MKYGYLLWNKPLLEERKERRMNLGDVFQSIATIGIYKRLGIEDEDIIPVDKYDLTTFSSDEPVVLLMTGAEIDSDLYAYHIEHNPLPECILPVYVGWLPNRDLFDVDISYLRKHQPIGCRSDSMVEYLREYDLDAFLTGCLTLTFPKRIPSESQNKVYLVDAPNNLLPYIPEEVMKDSVTLSQLIRIESKSDSLRLSDEETEQYHQLAYDRLCEYRDNASMVITSRLHVASPCAAMGIPVILARNYYDMRFQFIDRFIHFYTPDQYDKIDWQPKTEIPEDIKSEIVSTCKSLIDLAICRYSLDNIYGPLDQSICFKSNVEVVMEKIPRCPDDEFDYAIMGVALESSYNLHKLMSERFPKSKMTYAIDTYATGYFMDSIEIIKPDDVEKVISPNTLLLVNVARTEAKERWTGKYDLVLIDGTKVRYAFKAEI